MGSQDPLSGSYSWWLRTPGRSDRTVSIVNGKGIFEDGFVIPGGICGVRPAYHLNMNSVLFASVVAGGKSSDAVGADALKEVDDYSSNEWKLTLLDDTRSSFAADVDEAETSVEAGYSSWSIPVTYSGAQMGDNEYVSALLCDSNDTVLYYGNIAQNRANGTVTLNLPSGLNAGNYTLKVFSEQCNGDYKTDYAGAFKEISLNVTSSQETMPPFSFGATGSTTDPQDPSQEGTEQKPQADASVQTGDDSNMLPVIAVMVLAAAGAAAAVIYRRREE